MSGSSKGGGSRPFSGSAPGKAGLGGSAGLPETHPHSPRPVGFRFPISTALEPSPAGNDRGFRRTWKSSSSKACSPLSEAQFHTSWLWDPRYTGNRERPNRQGSESSFCLTFSGSRKC